MIYSSDISSQTTHRNTKCLNNIYRTGSPIKKEKDKAYARFKSLVTAEKTISGIEIMHMIRKGQIEEIQCVLSEVEFLNMVMGIEA